MRLTFRTFKFGLPVVNELRANLEKDVAKLVYNGSMKVRSDERYVTAELTLEPAFPPLYKFGWVLLFVTVLTTELVGWWALVPLVPGVLLSATQLFWTRGFYAFLFWLKLRPYGVVFLW